MDKGESRDGRDVGIEGKGSREGGESKVKGK